MPEFTPAFIREQLALAESATTATQWEYVYEPGKHIVIGFPGRGIAIVPNAKPDEPEKQINAQYICAACNSFPAALAEIARLQAELARLKAESEWVSVSERLPEEGVNVFVFTTEPKYTNVILTCQKNGEFYMGLYDDQPTHWRPLPAEPRSEK